MLSFVDEAFLQVKSHDIEEFEDGVYGISFLFQQFRTALLAVEKRNDSLDCDAFLFQPLNRFPFASARGNDVVNEVVLTVLAIFLEDR